MSIINEALKKTERYIQQNEDRNKPQGNGLDSTKPPRHRRGDSHPAVGGADSQSHNPPAKIIPAPKPFLLYILIMLAGIFLSSFIFRLLGDKIRTTQVPKKAAIAIQQPAILPPLHGESILPEEEKKVPETTFVLSGIFFSDNDGYALINNQIVRENDLVDGAKVARITENTVEIDSAGKLISLSTRK